MKEIKKLLQITDNLREKYPRSFPLDGRLVGDIGEILACHNYQLYLMPENEKKIDAKEYITDKEVQIKSTMKKYFTFPYDKPAEYLLAIKINTDRTFYTNKKGEEIYSAGSIKEVYNGPTKYITNWINKTNKKAFRKSYFSFSLGRLEKLNQLVKDNERIKKRKYYFRLSSFGYMPICNRTTIELINDNHLLFEIKNNSGNLINREIIEINSDKLTILIDIINKNEWKEKYENNNILDGGGWDFRLINNSENYEIVSSGSNLYPKNYNKIYKLLKEMINRDF